MQHACCGDLPACRGYAFAAEHIGILEVFVRLVFRTMGFMSSSCRAVILLAVLGVTEGAPFEGMLRGSGLRVLTRASFGEQTPPVSNSSAPEDQA